MKEFFIRFVTISLRIKASPFVVGNGPMRDSRSMNPKLYTSSSLLAIFLHNIPQVNKITHVL